MGFSRRFLLPENSLSIPPIGLCNLLSCDPEVNTRGLCVDSCFKVCPHVCKEHIVVGDDLPPPYFPTLPDPSVLPPPPPPSPLPLPLPPKLVINQGSTAQKHLIRTSIIVGSCMIGVSLLLCIVFAVMRFYSSRRNNPRRRRSSPILFATSDDFLDEDHGPVLEHPIWYIHTVGLSQALIDSITVCKYRKDVGLIEGTDCSVCLSEFEEDESLRLLPKCSHAFHIPCIDTWLRSHKNCPLCRAPIVCGAAAASDQVSVPESSIASGSSSGESTRVENSESVEGVGRGTSEVGSTDDENVCAISVESLKVLPNSILAEGSCDPRALSDLADNRRVSEDDVQPIRRSVSVDSMSASSIYRAVANILPEQGSSNSQLVLAKSPNSGILSKQDNASSSLSKNWRSSSSGFSLQMVPMAMKRPFPSGRKLFSSKHRRTLSSILPL